MPQQLLTGELDTDRITLSVEVTDAGWHVSVITFRNGSPTPSGYDAGAILDTAALDPAEATAEWANHVLQSWLYGSAAQTTLASKLFRRRLIKRVLEG